MSILSIDQALTNIDNNFRKKIISTYQEIKQRYFKAVYSFEYDSAGLSIGKFSETTLRFLQKELTGNYIPFGKHISNFNDECQKVMNLPTTSGVESLRIIIPRALQYLYTIRGKRGIGHIGGDVEANRIDIETIVKICDWVICELIRVFHRLSLDEAQSIVNSISEKTLPEIWIVAGKKRVLSTNLDFKEKTLLLLYTSTENFEFDEDLFKWIEYSDFPMFKRSILIPLHKKKMIEYDRETSLAYLSPIGIKEVEEKILKKIRK